MTQYNREQNVPRVKNNMHYYLKVCQNIWSWDTNPFKIVKIHWFSTFYISLNCTYFISDFSLLCNKILVNRLNTKKSLNKRKPPWHHVSLIICRCSSGKEGVRGQQQQPRGEEGGSKAGRQQGGEGGPNTRNNLSSTEMSFSLLRPIMFFWHLEQWRMAAAGRCQK